MLGLFFDVLPRPGHMPRYFEHVDRLKPILSAHPGLIYLERFRPLDDEAALLSHQHWADEAALVAWRRDPSHRVSQAAGRRVHFDSYRIRVGDHLSEVPAQGRFLVTLAGPEPRPDEGRSYESVTRPGRFLTVCSCDAGAMAGALREMARARGEDVHVFDISRDYTDRHRAEAPEA